MNDQAVAIGARCKRCASTKSELRKRVLENGQIQYRWQCLHCGHSISDALAHGSVEDPDSVPLWDAEIKENYEDWLKKSYIEKRVQETAFGLTFSFEAHSRYLKSPAWQQRRSLVLKRARGLCEGCGIAAATQVHHLTYAHWREEFLWELVAVCEICHERFHERELRKVDPFADCGARRTSDAYEPF